MQDFIHWIIQPWPWYIAGPLIGLTVPLLLLIGNKPFGISSSLRHICAACAPANIPFFRYNWRAEVWNLFFVLGIFLGGVVGSTLLANPEPIIVAGNTQKDLATLGIRQFNGLMPNEIFSWQGLSSLKGFIIIVIGGIAVGFGTRWAGGCTSGHAITGLANLQGPSLVATICFMIGGFFSTHVLLPLILGL